MSAIICICVRVSNAGRNNHDLNYVVFDSVSSDKLSRMYYFDMEKEIF